MVRLGYSTYAMREVDVFDALPRLRSMGYEAVEICVRDGWATAADVFDASARRKLVGRLRDLGFPPPPLMDSMSVCAEGGDREAMLRRAAATFSMARDVNFGDALAVVTTTLGSPEPPWDTGRQEIRDGFLELADLASQYGVVIAVEAHVGGVFETPEKAVWLMEETGHEHLKLNFDISHFTVQGYDLQQCVDLCAPYAVHTHVKDGYMVDGRVQFQLPGEGDLDLTAYMKAVARAGLELPVYVEVSLQLSGLPGYDPWQAAGFCYRALDEARREAFGPGPEA
ncbi:MAG: sugar phosphate isomerase/epimerase [Chloroflexi bacterium]|nr:sugar phosphate isomerase/epimerase [Chloroflexota bacterium]